MRRGELMEKDHIIIDEYFLWLNKYRAKLHQLLEEHTYAGLDALTKTYTFLSNPLSDYYAGQIEEKNMATCDRVDLFIPVNQPKIIPSESMMRKFSKYGRKEKPLEQVAAWQDYLDARKEIGAVEIPSKIIIWLTLFAHAMASCKQVPDKFSMSPAKLRKVCAACNENEHLCAKVCLSKPRFLRATIILSKGLAWLDGRREVRFSDLNEAIPYTLPHRLSWITEELSYAEALEEIQRLVQQFNDDMAAWRNRGIFSTLAAIVDKSKQKPPVYAEKEANSLLAEVSEVHLLKDFVGETLTSLVTNVSAFYLEEGRKKTFATLEELVNYVQPSGLNPYDKDDLIFAIAATQKFALQAENTDTNLLKIGDAIMEYSQREGLTVDEAMLRSQLREKSGYDCPEVKVKIDKDDIIFIFPDANARAKFKKVWES
jgi:hypothetical protein